MPCSVLGHIFLVVCLLGSRSVWAAETTPQELFAQADANGDKHVTFQEAAKFFHGSIDDSKLESLFKQADEDGSGDISLNEFQNAVELHGLNLNGDGGSAGEADASPLEGQASTSSEMRFTKLKAKTAMRARASSSALASSLSQLTAGKGDSAPSYNAAVEVDDQFFLFVDGAQVLSGTSWSTVYTANVNAEPKTIVIRGLNTGGPGGILGSFANGLITSTSSWRCTAGWPANAIQSGFNFLTWPTPVSHGVNTNGGSVWSQKSQISSSAQWIWYSGYSTNADNGWQYVTCAWQRPCDSGSDCNGHGSTSGVAALGCPCSCSAGWGGSTCATQFTACNNDDCNGRGTTSGYRQTGCGTCACFSGFSGTRCENVVCQNSPDCNNHGIASGVRPSCTCSCQNGYTGSTCAAAPVPCDASDCNNHGTASNYRYQGCSCSCSPGYTGSTCAVPPVPCDATDCNSKGNAAGLRFSGCTCQCNYGYTGATCTVPPDPCAGINCFASDQCHFAGTCAQGVCSNPVKADNVGCDDGNPSTIHDVCVSGVCKGNNPCGTLTCVNPGTAEMQCKTNGRCDVTNGNPSCSYDDKSDGTACDDGNPSTKNDNCVQGVCTGKDLCWDVVCQPLTQCYKAGTCTNGLCNHPQLPEGTICDDGDPKTGGDHCDDTATCVGSLAPVDGGLSDWTACTVSCGGGTQTRACNNPTPANGGKPCCNGDFGKAGCPDIQRCNTDVCANVLAAAVAAKQAADAGPTDACTPVPCKNGGKCTVTTTDSSGFHCDCFPGWSGDDCSSSQTEVSHTGAAYVGPEARTTRLEGINNGILGVPRWGDRGEVLISEWHPWTDNIYQDLLEKKGSKDTSKDIKNNSINSKDTSVADHKDTNPAASQLPTATNPQTTTKS